MQWIQSMILRSCCLKFFPTKLLYPVSFWQVPQIALHCTCPPTTLGPTCLPEASGWFPTWSHRACSNNCKVCQLQYFVFTWRFKISKQWLYPPRIGLSNSSSLIILVMELFSASLKLASASLTRSAPREAISLQPPQLGPQHEDKVRNKRNLKKT